MPGFRYWLAGAVLALQAACGAASAQTTDVTVLKPAGAPPPGSAAAPDGARYYPGIGFRYVLPPGERVYGYYRERPRARDRCRTGERRHHGRCPRR